MNIPPSELHDLLDRARADGYNSGTDWLECVTGERNAAIERADKAERRVAELEASLPAEAPTMLERAEAAEKRVADSLGEWAQQAAEATAAIRERNADTRARQLEQEAVELRASNARLVAERDQLQKRVNEAEAQATEAAECPDFLRVRAGESDKRISELQATIDRARAAGDYSDTDDVARGLQGEDEADRELGRMVRAMPAASDLKHINYNAGPSWAVFKGLMLYHGDTPEEALKKSGVTLPQAGEAGEPSDTHG